MGFTPFAARALGTVASSQGNSLSYFWLSLGVALDLGRIVSFAPSLGMPLLSMVSFNTAYFNAIQLSSLDRHFSNNLHLSKVTRLGPGNKLWVEVTLNSRLKHRRAEARPSADSSDIHISTMCHQSI